MSVGAILHTSLFIAATAIAHGVPVATRDAGYDEVPGLISIRA